MYDDLIKALLSLTAAPENLSFKDVRYLLSLQPSILEIASRLNALAKDVGGLLAPAMPAPAATPIPKPESLYDRYAITPQPRTSTWTLQEDDIKPGIIAWFDDDTLNTDRHVEKPVRLVNRVHAKGGRPFVCVQADDQESAWISLSRQYHANYLKVAPEWIRPRGALNGTSYVTGYTYRGPHNSFCVAAAHVEFPDASLRRPKMSEAGLDAIVDKFMSELT